jgi:hypothetical protein
METATLRKTMLRDVVIDFIALTTILLLPAAAHLTGIPLYMMEPMRLMLVISVAHGTRTNSLLLALVLPAFSYLVSGHPELIKMIIISGELVLNVILFYYFIKRWGRPMISMLSAIFISKFFCYLLYWPIFSWSFVKEEAQPLFLIVQVITSLIFSFYIMVILKNKKYE